MRAVKMNTFCSKGLSLLLLIFVLGALPGCNRAPEGMVVVPSGAFLMGTNEKDSERKAEEFGLMKPWYEDEQPAHQVSLPTYFIDAYTVTKAEYVKFAKETGYRPPSDGMNGRYAEAKARHPVTHVNWYDANAYCLWAGKRLPTEQEWEKAARGPKALQYPWGNNFDQTRANINNQIGNTVAVGSYELGKSPYGAYDMTGNVWEWTADWYAPYPGSQYQSDQHGEKVKVLRGNSWAGLGHFPPEIHSEIKAHYSRASYRLFMTPKGIVNDVGFRCVKSAK